MLNDQATRDHFDRVLRTITPNSIDETPNYKHASASSYTAAA